MKETISVVVPVYNVESYLERCVKSIVNQTYKNLDIILVDDGSTDHCGYMCDMFESSDNRIRVLHKENGGLSDARNAGIRVAQGEYITFVDSDDYISSNYIDELVRAIEDTDSDMSMVDTRVVDESSEVNTNPQIGNITVLSKKEAIKRTLHNNLRQSAWGKLYRRSVFKNVLFPVGMLYEDLAIVFNLLDQVSTIARSDAKLYTYVVRPGSIMQSRFNPKQYESLQVADDAAEFIKCNYPEFAIEAEGKKVYTYFTVLKNMSGPIGENEEIKKELIKRIKKNARQLVFSRDINKTLKLRIICVCMSERLYYWAESLLYKEIEKRTLE